MEPNNVNKDDFLLPKKPHNVDDPASPIRTFSTDLAQAVRKDEMSVIKVAIAEEKRREQQEENFSADSPKNRTYITLGIAFILVTVIGIGAVYMIKKNRTPEIVQSEAQIPTLITAENATSIEVGGLPEGRLADVTKTTVANVATEENKIINIYFTDSTSGKKQLVSAGAYLGGIKSQIPGALLRSLENTFMLGVYTLDSMHHPFIILRTTDFQTAFSSMFEWERKIFSDFYAPFNLDGQEDNFTNKFSDLLVENKDTRVLMKDDGTVTLIYGFVDEKSLIIADSVEAFKEVLHRLQSVR